MERLRHRNNISGSLTFGLLMIFLGVGFILNNLKYLEFGNFIGRWWPSIILGLAAINFLFRSAKFSSLIVTTIIFLPIQLAIFNILPGNFWSYFWPTILLIIGFGIIFSWFKPTTEDMTEDSVHDFVLFSGNDIRNYSKHFKGGEVTAVAGGIKLDLSEADIEDETRLKATSFMGGIEVIVPKAWKVIIKGLPIMGGFENKTNTQDELKKIFRIDATAIMGGVEVKAL